MFSIKIANILAIVAVVCFLVLIAMQVLEFNFYGPNPALP